MKQQQTVTSHVHGWLMNVPNYLLESPTWNELLVGEQNIGVIVIVELVNGR